MAVVQLSDIIQPEYFAEYMAHSSMVSTALFRGGVLAGNSLMQVQLGWVRNSRQSYSSCAYIFTGYPVVSR